MRILNLLITMRNYPYLRYILVVLSFIPMWILNLVIAPMLFITGTVNRVRRNTEAGRVSFWSWFVNIDEPTQTENNYGDDGFRARRGITDIESRGVLIRFWHYCNWNVIRNSFFYYRQYIANPIRSESLLVRVKVNTAGKEPLHLCNYSDRGRIHVIEERKPKGFKSKTVKYFRYSFTREITLWFFGKRVWNVQLGVNGIDESNRYLVKSKMTKLK